MPLNPIQVDQFSARIENVLNKFGWIPYVSTAVGTVRILAGKVQCLAGLVIAGFKFFHGIIANDLEEQDEAKEWAGYCVHGLANICRGTVEAIPFLNLLCLIYDAFAGRFNYRHEILQRGVYPLNPMGRKIEVIAEL